MHFTEALTLVGRGPETRTRHAPEAVVGGRQRGAQEFLSATPSADILQIKFPVGITREFVKRTGAYFSNKLLLLPLDIRWALGDDRMFADLSEITIREK